MWGLGLRDIAFRFTRLGGYIVDKSGKVTLSLKFEFEIKAILCELAESCRVIFGQKQAFDSSS